LERKAGWGLRGEPIPGVRADHSIRAGSPAMQGAGKLPATSGHDVHQHDERGKRHGIGEPDPGGCFYEHGVDLLIQGAGKSGAVSECYCPTPKT